MKTTIASAITKVNTMRDGSLRLQVDTQELTPEAMSEVFSLYGKFGYFYFDENSDKAPEIVDLPPVQIEDGQKKPSERLRSVLFVYWEQQGKKGNFNDFYLRKMDEWVEYIKGKLN